MISNIQNVSQDMIFEYYNRYFNFNINNINNNIHKRNYYGENVIITAVGDINHKQLEEYCAKHFNIFKSKPKNGI